MKKLAIQSFTVYLVALGIACFLNIDRIVPWYALDADAGEDSYVLESLVTLEELNHDMGFSAAMKEFDCSTTFLFNQSYKDNSECFVEETAQNPDFISKISYRYAPDVASSVPSTQHHVSSIPRTNNFQHPNTPNFTAIAPAYKKMSTTQRRAFARALYDYARSHSGAAISPAQHQETLNDAENTHVATIGTGPTPASETSSNDSDVSDDSAGPEASIGLDTPILQQPQTDEQEQQAAITPTKSVPGSILVIGDSLALGLAKSFERALQEYDGISFARVGKVSSGLAIPHLFNWEKKVQVLIDKYKPDLLLIMMGINDANNNIRVDNKKAILGTAFWPVAYQERVKRFLAIIAKKKVPVYWVGLPVVRDEAMTERIELTNTNAQQACTDSTDCHFIDTWDILTDDDGKYTNYKKDGKGFSIRIRSKDGVHLSREGGDLLSRFILNYMSDYVELKPKQDS